MTIVRGKTLEELSIAELEALCAQVEGELEQIEAELEKR
jgi:uncharacterized small protein (DUF1192 family)